jgi:hypothetical protein
MKTRNLRFRVNGPSVVILGLIVITACSALVSSAQSASPNLCGSCHGGGYSQVLDIREGDSANQLPTTLNVGETKTVVVAVENAVNTARYAALSVSLTLRSGKGHFLIRNPTYYIGYFPAGVQNAVWQITGTSDGEDQLVITATGRNGHENLAFSDGYSPTPSVVVGTPNPSAPSIQLTSPADGETWLVNSTHQLSWSSTGGVGQVKVTLEYGTTGTDPWISIASDLPVRGSYTWKLPDMGAQIVYLRATAFDSAVPPHIGSAMSSIQLQQPSPPSSSTSSSAPAVPEFPTAQVLAGFMIVMVVLGVFLRKHSA